MKALPKPGTIAFAREFFAHRDPAVLAVLRQSSVGIAGAGGLGSNVAVALARAGIGRLVIADFDRIEPSNLNRQQYFVDQVGERKVEALRENLLAINPYSLYEIHDVRINRQERDEDLRPGGRPRRGVRPGRGQGDAHRVQPVAVPRPARSSRPRAWPATAGTTGSTPAAWAISTSAATRRARTRRASARWRRAWPWSRPCRPTWSSSYWPK